MIHPTQLCEWSAPKRVETKYGPKDLLKAQPTEQFWGAWRADKPAMKSQGLSVSRLDDGQWEALWWRPIAKEEQAQREQAREMSRATDAPVDIPAPDGLSYLPFQRAGIAYSMARSNVLLGDQMGLGKTIQAIGVINADVSIKNVVVVCPASLKLNWKREIQRWLTRDLTVGIVNGGGWRDDVNIRIINYDVLHKHANRLVEREWDLLIADEIHYAKNARTRRAKHTYAIRARRKLYLTGTPIVNRPAELFPIIHSLDPVTWPKFFSFAKRYANAHHNGWGWDFSGANNERLPELQRRLRETIMVRRLKSEVLTELPAKTRQVIEIPANGAGRAIGAEREAMARHEDEIESLKAAVEIAKASDDPEDYTQAVEALKQGVRVAFTEISRLRHETAMAKVPHIIEHLRDATEDGTKVIVFAHHKDVIAAIAEEFAQRCVTLTGETTQARRQEAVDRFQNDTDVILFVGSITAAGVGLTLTAASHVVFAELDWVPGNVTQAEDRCHRIGQTSNVLVHHLVLEGSLDANMARTLVEKQEIIDLALDKVIEQEPVMPVHEQHATRRATRADLEKDAETITQAQVEAVHTALRRLAGSDPDRALYRNDMGFNALDGRIGHSLAEQERLTPMQAALGRRIVRKYHRQLDPALMERITE